MCMLNVKIHDIYTNAVSKKNCWCGGKYGNNGDCCGEYGNGINTLLRTQVASLLTHGGWWSIVHSERPGGDDPLQ